MDKKSILSAIKELKEKSKKRNFNQSFDLVINLKGIDLKKPEHKIDNFLTLTYGVGKKIKVAGLVDKELSKESKEVLDKVILKEDFPKLTKQEIKNLANQHDFFIAQSTIMTDVAKYFGKILGPKNRMPNPKAGCVITQASQLKPIYETLQKTIKLQTKNEPIIKCIVGKVDMKDEQVAENILAIYNNLLSALPLNKQNIKNVLLKLTMSQAIVIGDKDGKGN